MPKKLKTTQLETEKEYLLHRSSRGLHIDRVEVCT